jgi:hypothetical protein
LSDSDFAGGCGVTGQAAEIAIAARDVLAEMDDFPRRALYPDDRFEYELSVCSFCDHFDAVAFSSTVSRKLNRSLPSTRAIERLLHPDLPPRGARLRDFIQSTVVTFEAESTLRD